MVCCCKKNFTHSIGLISYLLGGIDPCDVEFVAAFDVNEKKNRQGFIRCNFSISK